MSILLVEARYIESDNKYEIRIHEDVDLNKFKKFETNNKEEAKLILLKNIEMLSKKWSNLSKEKKLYLMDEFNTLLNLKNYHEGGWNNIILT